MYVDGSLKKLDDFNDILDGRIYAGPKRMKTIWAKTKSITSSSMISCIPTVRKVILG